MGQRPTKAERLQRPKHRCFKGKREEEGERREKKKGELCEDVVEREAKLAKIDGEAELGDGAESAGGEANADKAAKFSIIDALALKVGELAHFGVVVSVGDAATDQGFFPCKLTCASHKSLRVWLSFFVPKSQGWTKRAVF